MEPLLLRRLATPCDLDACAYIPSAEDPLALEDARNVLQRLRDGECAPEVQSVRVTRQCVELVAKQVIDHKGLCL
jgi:hypothetical protein